MKSVEGVLMELGNNLQGNLGTTYSYISIGQMGDREDTMVQNVVVPRGLDNFLRQSLNISGYTTLYLLTINRKSLLMGIKTPDGKFYCHRQDAGLGYLMVLLGIPLLIVLIGIVFIQQGTAILSGAEASKELQKMGAKAIG